MAVTDFLLVTTPEIKGESHDADFEGAIEIASWEYKVDTPRTATYEGARGKAVPSNLVLTKRLDKSSPILLKSVCQNTLYDSATLYCRKAGGGQKGYFEIKLTDMRVRSVEAKAGGAGGVTPMEEISLSFIAIEWLYREQSPGGYTGVEVSFAEEWHTTG